jgi:hypothetical protein
MGESKDGGRREKRRFWYVQFGKGVLNGFNSIVASCGRKDKRVDFFLPFVNGGGSI